MSDKSASILNCGCALIIFVLNLIFGGMSVNYLLEVFANKVIPFGWAMVIGMFAGEITIPVALVTWILKHFGVF